MKGNKLFRRSIALTNEHGSWVFILSPLIIGIIAGQRWTTVTIYLIVAALSAFLLRHPLIIATKVRSGRRPDHDMPGAIFWSSIYGSIGLAMVFGLVLRGYTYLLLLAVPGIPVFIWHLALVRKRKERRKMGIEIIASGVLALVAPAAYWIGVGYTDPLGWVLWGLVWLQSAASIVYIYLRLDQRQWKVYPGISYRLQRGKNAVIIATMNIIIVFVLANFGILTYWMILVYSIQWLESIFGTFNPAIMTKPTAIGFRQLAVSILYTLLFIVFW